MGPKRDAKGEWRRLQNEEHHRLYRTCYLIREIKSGRVKWAYHVARMNEGRSALKILTGTPARKRL